MIGLVDGLQNRIGGFDSRTDLKKIRSTRLKPVRPYLTEFRLLKFFDILEDINIHAVCHCGLVRNRATLRFRRKSHVIGALSQRMTCMVAKERGSIPL